MAQKWNLQDIRPAGPKPQPPRSVGVRQRPQQDIAPREPEIPPRTPDYDPDLSTIEIIDGNSAKRKRVIVSSLIAVVVIGAGIAMNMMLGGATLTIEPKTREVAVQSSVIAKIDPQINELGYELLTLEATGERQVKAAGKETVSEQATGKIFIYNTGTVSQRLIKNTRFETKDGLIFRIQESVEVPAARGSTPGSIAADVFADGPGEQYNIPPQRFTVPGLEGSEQFDRIYGESQAAFTGGFSGEKYIIDEVELSTAKQGLHLELRNTLLNRLKNERPAGFVLFDDAVTVSFESLETTEYGDSLATIKERARLQVPLFKEENFASFIAAQGVPEFDGSDVAITDPYALSFKYESPTTTVSDISSLTELNFMLSGSARVVWEFNEDDLKESLLGRPKNEAAAIFAQFPAIRSAQAEIRPFWASSFPDNPNDIDAVLILE
jgi:hypothetical protein